MVPSWAWGTEATANVSPGAQRDADGQATEKAPALVPVSTEPGVAGKPRRKSQTRESGLIPLKPVRTTGALRRARTTFGSCRKPCKNLAEPRPESAPRIPPVLWEVTAGWAGGPGVAF